MSEESKHIFLKWNEETGDFEPIEKIEGDGIFLELVPEEKKWIYSYQNASLIQRRTSERKAHGISKTGYVHPVSGIRYGVEYSLVETKDQYEDMPDDLKKAQRAWYKG